MVVRTKLAVVHAKLKPMMDSPQVFGGCLLAATHQS